MAPRLSVPPIAFLRGKSQGRRRSPSRHGNSSEDEDEEDQLDTSPIRSPGPFRTANKSENLPLTRKARARIRILYRRGYSLSFIRQKLHHSHLTVTKALNATEAGLDEDHAGSHFLKTYPGLKGKPGVSSRLANHSTNRPITPIPTPPTPGSTRSTSPPSSDLAVKRGRTGRPMIISDSEDSDIVPESPQGFLLKEHGVSKAEREVIGARHTAAMTSGFSPSPPSRTMLREQIDFVSDGNRRQASIKRNGEIDNVEVHREYNETTDDEIEYTGCSLKGVPDPVKIISSSGEVIWLE